MNLACSPPLNSEVADLLAQVAALTECLETAMVGPRVSYPLRRQSVPTKDLMFCTSKYLMHSFVCFVELQS